MRKTYNRRSSRKKNNSSYYLRMVSVILCAILLIGIIYVLGKSILGGEDQKRNQDDNEKDSMDNVAMDTAKSILSELSLEEKVYQLFIVTPEQLTGVSEVTQSGLITQSAIQEKPVGGIVYFSANLISRGQCKEMIDNIQSYSKLGLFISVDEEGGDVARIGNNPDMETTAFPSMESIGDRGDISEAYNVGFTIGREISELGFNLDFAPVADINSNAENTVIGTRAFSSDPEIVSNMVSACIKGFKESGVLCTVKHFPGHGDTVEDSHYGEAQTYKTLDELYECEFIPFEASIEAGVPLIMVGHITTPNLDEENVPASLSYRVVTEILRNNMEYSGLIITDSMSMGAIVDRYSSEDAAVKALKAGVDLILMPYNLENAVAGVMDAVAEGNLTEERIDESVLRILMTKIDSGIIDTYIYQ